MTAELDARRSAAEAVVNDFATAANGFIAGDQPEPAWQDHAWRLASELRGLLGQLDAEQADETFTRPQPHPAVARLAQVQLVLDSFDWTSDSHEFALEQINDVLNGGEG